MSIILSAKPDTALHRVLYLDLINHFISIIVLKVQRATLYHFYFLCKAVKFHIKQCVCTAYMLCCILLRPLLMQFVVSSAFCHHRCVFMRVNSWWRAVSVHVVYAGGNCDPSLDGVVTQVPEHSLAQSSRLTFPLLYDRQLKEEPSNYLHPKTSSPSFTRFEKPTHVWVRRKKYPLAVLDIPAVGT